MHSRDSVRQRGPLEYGEVDPLRVVLEVVEEHPVPLQSLRVLADYDVLEIVGFIESWQGEEEVAFGHHQMQIDFAAAEKLDSASKRVIPEGVVLQPQLLDDPLGCD